MTTTIHALPSGLIQGLSRRSVAAGASGLALLLGACLLPAPSQAGPVVRRYQERKACETFAGKLQAASANPAMAQQIYQQGVLALVAKFGENPCSDIPPPVAAAAGAPVVAPVQTPPAAAAAAAVAPAAKPSAEQQQACTTFASKLSAAAASSAAQAKQVYAMGTEKLIGMFGPNPCPAVKPPN